MRRPRSVQARGEEQPIAATTSVTATPPRNPGYRIRPARPPDAAALVSFYATLSPESRRSRFLGLCSGIGEGMARHFCDADHQCREGIVALIGERIVGHVCLEPVTEGTEELAIAVADDVQRRGIGRALFRGALDWASLHGTRRIIATAYAWNAPVLRLLDSAPGGSSATTGAAGVVSVQILVTPDAGRIDPAA